MTKDLRNIIYNQDCQSWRHQDNLTWGRFLTAATIEAGMLYGLYQNQLEISAFEKLLLSLFGGALVLIVCLLSLKDNVDARGHLKRVKQVEAKIAPFKAEPWFGPSGALLLKIAIVIISLGNIGLIIKFLCAYLHD